MSHPHVKLFLCGDVMMGRGVDQILPHPSDPRLHEPELRDAREYVWLAEQANGPIEHPVSYRYLWGEALGELDHQAPAARIVNLETSITRSANPWRSKECHYRMHPANLACLTEARLDVCVLANNHVLDYGREGLLETLEVLREAGVSVAGAGRTIDTARAPAFVPLATGARVVVFAFAASSSGVPSSWAAASDRPGVALLPDLSEETARAVVEGIRRRRRPDDLVVVSIHWGPNWGWDVGDDEVRFAHELIDGGVDLVHGHSSHHPRPMEVYEGRLILYGCGDFIDDYEGIVGVREFRDDLRLMYFPTLHAVTGALEALTIVPLQAHRLSLRRPSADDRQWLLDTLNRISQPFDSSLDPGEGFTLALRVPRMVHSAPGPGRWTVRSLMTAPPETIDADEAVAVAARRMRDANVGMLPVVARGELVGVVTDRDLVVRVVAAGRNPEATAVREVMTEGIVTCSENDDAADAASLMVRKVVRRLLVLGADGHLAGVLSIDDVAMLEADGALPAVIGTAEPVPPLADPP